MSPPPSSSAGDVEAALVGGPAAKRQRKQHKHYRAHSDEHSDAQNSLKSSQQSPRKQQNLSLQQHQPTAGDCPNLNPPDRLDCLPAGELPSATDKQQQLKPDQSRQSLPKCFFVLAMVVAAAICVLGAAVLLGHLLHNNQPCPDSHQQSAPSLSAHYYPFYATKTSYAVAHFLLNPSATPTIDSLTNANEQQHNSDDQHNSQDQQHLSHPHEHSHNHNHEHHQHHAATQKSHLPTPSAPDMPKLFGSQPPLSLQAIHDKMTSQLNCTLRHLFFIGRHAARYPKAKEIKSINDNIAAIKMRLKDIITTPNPVADTQPQQVPTVDQDISSRQTSPASESPTIVATNSSAASITGPLNNCIDLLVPYHNWRTFMSEKQDQMIMPSGFSEEEAIAKRLKRIYPDAFNATTSRITIGVSNTTRTAQTASSFIKLLDDYDFECSQGWPDSRLINDSTRADELRSHPCVSRIESKFKKPELRFEDQCGKKFNISREYNIDPSDPSRRAWIAESVSKLLQLQNDNIKLTIDELDSIYKVCKFEAAYSPVESSIWCNLFTKEQLQYLEYISDVEDYLGDGYGAIYQPQSSCPIVGQIIDRFVDIRDSSTAPNLQTNLYFTHSSEIQRILATSVDLSNVKEFKPQEIKRYLDAQGSPAPPADRQWRSSLFTPFSANLLYTLYTCPAPANPPKGFHAEKMVVSLNERPIVLHGCQDHVCDLSRALEKGRINMLRGECDLAQICKV